MGGNIPRALREYRRKVIAENYVSKGRDWCAKQLGIEPSTVTKTAQKIGVKAYSREAWPHDKKEFISNNLDKSNRELAKLVNEPYERVRVLAGKLRRARRKDVVNGFLQGRL